MNNELSLQGLVIMLGAISLVTSLCLYCIYKLIKAD